MTLFITATGLYSQLILINGKPASLSDLSQYQIINDTTTVESHRSLAKTFADLDTRVEDYNQIFPKGRNQKSLRRIRPDKLKKVDWDISSTKNRS